MYFQTRAFNYNAPAPDPSKVIVRDVDTFWSAIRYLEQFPRLSYDLETSGTAWARHARLCGAAFGAPLGNGRSQCFYFPTRHQTGERQLPEGVVRDGLRVLLENERIAKTMHNRKFEHHMTLCEGIQILGPQRDTMTEAHLFDENRKIGLKERVAEDLKNPDASLHESIVDAEIVRLHKQAGMKKEEYRDAFGYSQVPIDLLGTYACFDVDFTNQLADFYDRVGVTSVFAETIALETELTDALVEMERNGLRLDVPYLEKLREMMLAEMERVAPMIFSAVGYSFDLGSADELREVLVRKLGLPLFKETDKRDGTLSVDADVLDHFTPEAPVCGIIKEWRVAEKIVSTYTSSIVALLGYDGLLHGDYQSLGTKTGRLSCRWPNLQNFPGDSDKRAKAFSGKKVEDGGIDPWSLKRAFPVDPDLARIFLDYSQIELRILAQYTKDPVLLDAYAKDEDIHNRTSLEVFGTLGEAERRKAKVINFGLTYGLGAQGFARQAKIPLEEAEHFLGVFFQRYAGIKSFREDFCRAVRANGCQFRDMWGRPRRVPDLNSFEKWRRGSAERRTIGSLIQGSAAHLTKASLVRIHRWEKRNRAGIRPKQTVHDEITFDVPRHLAKELGLVAKGMMEDFPQVDRVPIKADAKVSTTTWAEKHSLFPKAA